VLQKLSNTHGNCQSLQLNRIDAMAGRFDHTAIHNTGFTGGLLICCQMSWWSTDPSCQLHA
jgi:hypothetical protein